MNSPKRIVSADIQNFLSKFDTVLFDCDGVLWVGTHVISRTQEAIELLKKQGKRIFYITNNSTKTREDYAEKLNHLGYTADKDDIVCTAHVTAAFLKDRGFHGKVYVIGPTAVEKELDAVGIRWTKHENETVDHSKDSFAAVGRTLKNDPEVRCVLVGADLSFNYEKLSRACLYLYKQEEQCLFIGTNCDAQFPLEDGRAMPGTGSLVHAVAYASSRTPVMIGKPDRPMYDFLHDNYHIEASRTLMVGDRLDTDIKLACDHGMVSLLVLTGVHQLDDVRACQLSDDPSRRKLVPDFYIDSITELAEYLAELAI